MIGYIQGTVIQCSAPSVCILTTTGIGYDVELPVPDFCQLALNTDVQIWTHLVVREDAQLLYGFIKQAQRDVFRQLIKINGVGAKMALAMLSNLTITELKQCVADNNESILVRIPGIGKKTAQRLLIELEDKIKFISSPDDLLSDSLDSSEHSMESSYNTIVSETKAALMSLGYKEKEADQAIKLAKKSSADDINDIQTLLKLSLQQLSKY